MVLTDDDGSKTLVELKTTGGFSFKMMATTFKGGAQGPRFSYVLQAAMMAKALGVDKFIIALLSLEPVSPQLAEAYASSESGRFAAEWHFTADFDDVIRDEAHRVEDILAAVKAQTPPPRMLHDPEFPKGAAVINPMAARAPTVTVDNVLLIRVRIGVVHIVLGVLNATLIKGLTDDYGMVLQENHDRVGHSVLLTAVSGFGRNTI